MRGSLVRIKVLDEDQGFDYIKAIVEVWARQGLVPNVDLSLQIIDEIRIERILVTRKKIKGFPK